MVNHNSSMPLYLQIARTIKEQIQYGQLQPGDKICSEGELCTKYKVSRVTVRNALSELVAEGLLVRKHGKGTYVTAPTLIDNANMSESFSGFCKLNNYKPETKVIKMEKVVADNQVSKRLGVEAGSEIIQLKRIRYINQKPAIFEIDYFRLGDDYVLTSDFTNQSLLACVLNNSKFDIHTFNDAIQTSTGSEEIDSLMDTEPGFVYLRVDESVLSANGEIVYFNTQYINSQLYTYNVKSYRGGD